MFKSFFPKPKLYFGSVLVWSLLCGAAWFLFLSDWTAAHAFFANFTSAAAPDGASQPFLTPEKLHTYTYMVLCGVAFGIFWTFASDNPWKKWSVWGSILIVLAAYFSVQLDVYINKWYGEFFDILGGVLGGEKRITEGEYYSQISTIAIVLVISISVRVLVLFFTQHYIFRWRTAMNNYYVHHWDKVRMIEGASQRVQEDSMRFARQLETLGMNFVGSIMTLIAFLPILWGLSHQVKVLPFIGEVNGGLVFVSLVSASFGTILLALVGIKLPGLEFRNQRVEAAYRKELVYGEDSDERAGPITLKELFSSVRLNYFKLYFNYLYFNVAKWAYLQGATFLPYLAMGPSVAAKAITMGIFHQVLNAFGNVDDSLRFFAKSWDNIVELQSIYKRLKAFEAVIDDKPLPGIDNSFLEAAQSGVNPDAPTS